MQQLLKANELLRLVFDCDNFSPSNLFTEKSFGNITSSDANIQN